MPYQIFICHSYDHRSIYFDLVEKLNDAPRFEWRNMSVQYDMRLGSTDDEKDDDELRLEIGQRLADCQVFLVLTKPIAGRRRWLQWEIEHAKKLGKPIIGIARKKNDLVSKFVRERSIDIVDTWRTDHIVHAIKGYAAEYAKAEKKALRVPDVLPLALPDIVEPANPTPDQPLRPTHGFVKQALPRDVLYPDIGSIVPGQLPRISKPEPRWWWPFSRGDLFEE